MTPSRGSIQERPLILNFIFRGWGPGLWTVTETISDLESDALKSDTDLTPLPEKMPSRLRGESLLVISGAGLTGTGLTGAPQSRLVRSYQRLIHQVLAEEPNLQFIGAQDVADGQIVGAGIAQFVRTFRQCAAVSNDDLVRIQQAGNLYWHFFPAPRRPLDARGFGHIGRHGNRDATQKLDPLGDRVHNLRLFFVVLVEQEVKLVEGWSGNLPVRFLIEIAQRHGVG